MQPGTKELILGGLGGAVIGALLTVSLTVWFDWRKEVRDVEIKKEILAVKREFLNDLKENIKDSQEAVTEVRMTREQALQDADRIRVRREQAELIIERLKDKTSVTSEAVAKVLKPELRKEVRKIASQWKILVGTVKTRSSKEPGEETALAKGSGDRSDCGTVKFTTPFQSPPKVVISINHFETYGHKTKGVRYQRLLVDVGGDDIYRDKFKYCFKTWDDSIVAKAKASWIAFGLGQSIQ